MIHKKHLAHPLVHTTLSLYGIFLFLLITLMSGAFAHAVFAEGTLFGTFGTTTDSPSMFTATTSSDVIPPSTPIVSVNSVSSDEIELSWPPATDNDRIMGYKVFRNGVLLNLVAENDYLDIDLLPNTTYRYMVRAIDMAGNQSSASNVLSVTTSSQTSSDSTSVTPASPTHNKAVTFSVTPSTGAPNCASGKAVTDVYFVLSDPAAGSFLLSREGTSESTGVEWGTYHLANGIYHWKLLLNPEFTGAQETTGSFTLHGACLTSAFSTSTTPDHFATSSESPIFESPTSSKDDGIMKTIIKPFLPKVTSPSHTETSPSATPKVRTILKVFVDNEPVTDPEHIFTDEDIELRVTGTLMKKVNFVALGSLSPQAIQLGNGVIDDLLSTDKGEVWTYVWSAKSAQEGTYKVHARVLRTDGTVVETVPVVLRIIHGDTSSNSEETGTDTNPTTTHVSTLERAQILERVSDPHLCSNASECKIFCASSAQVNERCKEFARARIEFATTTPSLTDTIPDNRLRALLENPDKRPKEIPLAVQDPAELKLYCATPEHGDTCAKVFFRNDLATTVRLEKKKDEIKAVHAVEEKVFTERVGTRAFVDTDGDGISDYDEINIYHTNPNDPDTDHDGVPDGVEILARTNPLGTTSEEAASLVTGTTSEHATLSSEEVRTENPLIAGSTYPLLLQVSSVAASDVVQDQKGSTTAKKLKISGKALANSFVTLFIFSDPIVVTVKSDETGAWTYTLDKELPDGTHQVVSAITDSGGRILAKSDPLPFVKEAAAVSLGTLPIGVQNEAPSFWSGGSLFALLAVLIALLGIALSVIGFMVHRRHDGDIQGGGGTLAS